MTDYPSLRQSLHEHPQTAGNEQFAHDLIVRHLQQLHPAKVYTHVGGYGVIAVWEAKNSSPCQGEVPEGIQNIPSPCQGEVPEGRRGLPTIAFRADTDALPIGHRCGHDGHTAILLRLAELIDGVFAEHSTLTTDHCTLTTGNNILLLFQPAEETGQGARAVLESGILQQYDIRAIYALHNIPGYPLGTVVLCPHTFAAASTGIVFRLDGRETHASTPELGINPGLAVAEIVQQFDAFNATQDSSPCIESFRQSTLICVRLGSPAFGTSAGSAELMFTLRAFTNAAMERLLADANAAVDEIASRHSLKVSRSLVEPFRATENTPACVEEIKKACEAQAPQDNFQFSTFNFQFKNQPFRWSEDFGEYLRHFPGAMFGIGSGEHQPELHHPDYDFPDALIEPAARLFFSILTSHPAAI